MHLSLIHVLKVTVNRRLESTAFDNKIKYTDRCIVAWDDWVEVYITFAVILFFIILKKSNRMPVLV